MNPETRRNLLRHAVAIDLMVLAAGLAYLFPGSPVVLFGAFLAAVAISAWIGGDEVGLAATAYAVIILSFFFGELVDVTSLTAFAATGAIASTIARVARQIQQQQIEAPAIPAPAKAAAAPTLPFFLGLPLLVVVLYTDVSDLVMRYSFPSLLQPLIVVLLVAVLRHHRICRPASATVQPIIFAFSLYAVVVLASSVWAGSASLADERLAETVKAIVIAILAASLSPSWVSLRRAFTALLISAAVLSAISVVQIATGQFFDILGGLVSPQLGTIYGEVSSPRAAGPPNSDPNFYARILLMTIPIAIGLAITEPTLRRRIAYGSLAGIITAGTLVTYSRGAMLTLAMMALMLFVALRVKPRYVAMAGVAGLVGLLILPEGISRRFLTIETLMPDYDTTFVYDSSVEKRKLLVATAVAMFDKNPIGGVGAGNYTREYQLYANEIGTTWMDYHPAGSDENPHGLYVELAAETGLLGLFTFCGTVVVALFTLRRAKRIATERGDSRIGIIAMTVGVGLASYMIASVFLHETHLRYIALYFGFCIALVRIAVRDDDPVEAIA